MFESGGLSFSVDHGSLRGGAGKCLGENNTLGKKWGLPQPLPLRGPYTQLKTSQSERMNEHHLFIIIEPKTFKGPAAFVF